MDRIFPDRAALEVAHSWLHRHSCLQKPLPLDEMLKNASLKIILEILARRHMQRRSRVDVKKLQANDLE